jgi:ABC-type multidrug transport system fused ATPase/permease subunit
MFVKKFFSKQLESYKLIYRELIKENISLFIKLFLFLLLEGFTIVFSILSLVPIADYFADNTLSNASYITEFFIKIYAFLGVETDIVIFLLGFIFFNFLKAINNTLIAYGIINIKYTLIKKLTFDFLENCFNSRWLFFQRHSQGRFINIYNNEIGKISSSFYDFVTQSSMSIKFLTYLITPFFLNFQITITTLILAIIFTLPFLLLGKFANKLGYRNTITGKNFLNGIAETLQAAKLIIGYNKQSDEIFRNQNLFLDHLKVTTKFQILSSITSFFYQPLAILAVSIALIYSLKTQSNIAELAAVLYSLVATLPMLGSFVQSNLSLQNLTPSLIMYKSLIEESKSLKERKLGKKLDKPINQIEFKNISFKYDNGFEALNNCNLLFKKNLITAISGKSGAGKSTLLDLLIGIQVPCSGKIFIDDKNLEYYDLLSYREKISIVSQDPFLFNVSILDNLRWTKNNIDENHLKECLKLANCDDFIDKLPNKIQTIVGERGMKLSGGQRQRVSLARAIITEPEVLILDEPTSSLDKESEELIFDSLKKISKFTTIILITHDSKIINLADKIYFIKDGRVENK